MAEELREIPPPSDDEVSTSPTKKKTEQTAFHLFGARIPFQDSSSLAPKETTYEAGCSSENPNEDVSLALCSNPNADLEVTCADHKKETEEARKIKKMRLDLDFEKEELREQLPLDTWTIKKTLTTSDINGLTRLLVPISAAEEHILPHLSPDVQNTIQGGNGVRVRAYDHDTNTEHNMILKRMVNTTGSYVFNGGWAPQFVRRRKLKEGYQIGLFWNTAESRLHFSVLSTVLAD